MKTPRSILLIDDEPDLTGLLSGRLSKRYKVFRAKDAQEGISLFLEKMPDLVVLDINLPDKSGVEVLKTILAHDAAARVLMLSSTPSLSVARETIKLGAKDFISKPFELRDFDDRVRAILDGAVKKD